MLSLYCTALGFISKNEEYNSEENIPNSRYMKNLILQKVVKQQKIISLSVVIIHFCFQCMQITMNNILTSGGLRNVRISLYKILSVCLIAKNPI